MLQVFHSEPIHKFRFLVTGGAGFIGSHLVEYLLTHGAAEVVVLDNLATGFQKNLSIFSQFSQLTFIQGDIRDPQICNQACEGIDFVLHQAALGSVPRSINDPQTTNEVNITGFLNILVAARDQKVKRMVYAASSSTYGDSKELPKREEIIGKPLSPYAITKYVNELYASVFSSTYGFDSIGLRYFNVFGPRQDPNGAYAAVIPLFIQSLIDGKSPYINGDGLQTRDFTFVENAVQANIKALFAPEIAANKVYNVAVGDRTSLKQMFEILQQVSGKDIQAIHRESRAGDIRDSLADISLAVNSLGYQPTVRIEEGLKRTFHWFVDQQHFIKSS
jgi:UDP-N-acetylglucosamine 4-epimerase